jgi:DNA-binding NarL/FixJ family response regulator
VPALKPQVAVLDVRLPDGDGVTVCREMRSRMPELACLMLTSFGDDEALFDAIMAGAAGYRAQAGPRDGPGRRGAHGGGRGFAAGPEADQGGDGAAAHRGHKDPLAALTAQERRILELIGEGLTNRQIGERMFLAEKTVKNYVSSLMSKLGMERGCRRPSWSPSCAGGRSAARTGRGARTIGPKTLAASGERAEHQDPMNTTDAKPPACALQAECVALLATQEVGRLVYTLRALPAVTPVNFVLREGAVWIWTASTSSMWQAVRGAVVAFEVTSWTRPHPHRLVGVVLGVAELVTRIRSRSTRARSHGPEPWVPGRKEHLVRIPLKLVSGRRVGSRTK